VVSVVQHSSTTSTTPDTRRVRPDVPGLLELLEASKKLAALAVTYDDWRRDVKVQPLAAEPAANMNYYSHLLDAVVPEQASIPVLLHGMLEQVTSSPIHAVCPHAAL
jgi:hypothetical protein